MSKLPDYIRWCAQCDHQNIAHENGVGACKAVVCIRDNRCVKFEEKPITNRMSKETQQVTQYKLYTLYENVEVKVGKKEDGTDVIRVERRPVGHFDDKALLLAYIGEDKTNDRFAYNEDWIEYEPEATRFGLPLNPSLSVEEGENTSETNGDN